MLDSKIRKMLMMILLLLRILTVMGLSSDHYRCTMLPTGQNNHRWLLAETSLGGLCNQISAVLSFFPAAKVFKMNLVIGPIYSRHSFEDTWPTPKRKWSTFPFSSFFDWDYFRQYWQNHGILVVESDSYAHRCPWTHHQRLLNSSGHNGSHTQLHQHQLHYSHHHHNNNSDYRSASNNQDHYHIIYNITRNPVWGAVDSKRLLHMLHTSQLPDPLPDMATFRIQANLPYLTLFDFWSNPELLLRVYNSLQPSIVLEKFIRTIRSQLGTEYIALHLRLEPDYFGHDADLTIRQAEQALWWLSQAPCLQPFKLTNGSDSGILVQSPSSGRHILPRFDTSILPPIYLATGIFGTSSSSNSKSKSNVNSNVNSDQTNPYTANATIVANTVRSYLDKMGFTSLVTRSQQQIMQDIAQRIDDASEADAESLRGALGDSYVFQRLTPEHNAYIDLEIARMSRCFVPAHIGTSFSYMVMRMRDWDAGLKLSFEEVHGRDNADRIDKHGISHDFTKWGY